MASSLVDSRLLALYRPPAFGVRSIRPRSCPCKLTRLREDRNVSNGGRGLTLGLSRLEQHGRDRRRVIIRAKKERSGDDGLVNKRGDLKLEATDMMELEFGRLLGEDRQTTLAKVVGKKLNPELTYVKIEKEKELKFQKQAARRSVPSRLPPSAVKADSASYNSFQGPEEGVPDLISPPVRPPGFKELESLPMRTIRVIPPVGSGGVKKSAVSDSYELEGLMRKPMRVPDSEVGMPPARPDKAVITPMLMRRKTDSFSQSQQPGPGDRQLRRPSISGPTSSDDSTTPDLSTPPSVEDVQSTVADSDMSEERFRQLLEGKPSPLQQAGQEKFSRRPPVPSVQKTVLPLVKPNLPSLEKKPSVLENPQLIEATMESSDITNLPTVANISNPSDNLSDLPIAEVPSTLSSLPTAEVASPQPRPSFKPKAKLSRSPPLLKPKSKSESLISDEAYNNGDDWKVVVDEMKPNEVIRLEDSGLEEEKIETEDETIPGEGLTDNREEDISPFPSITDEGLDALSTSVLEIVDHAPSKEDYSIPVVSERPIIRLRKTNLPLQQPAKPDDEGARLASASQATNVGQESDLIKQSAVQPALDGQEKIVIIAEEDNTRGQERKESQMRKPVPSLKLSKPLPAPPGAFTVDKAAQENTTMNTLQKAIKSFDDKRLLPNKKEEDEDWARAEALRDSKSVEEVKIIGTGRGGLLVGFGSLVGFLPAFELTASRRPMSFSVWEQTRGFNSNMKEPSEKEDQVYDGMTTQRTSASTQRIGDLMNALDQRGSKIAKPELLDLFKVDRARELSLLVGQKANVIVTSVDRALRQLRVSEKQAEGEGQELSQKKVNLMESLTLGDVVTCEVKKITTFGAFVDLQGVPALIHSSEISWNRNTDPLSVLQVGQEVKVKVCKLDRFLQRINLSLKLMQPDPLLETLESLISTDTEVVGPPMDAETEPNVEMNKELNGFVNRLGNIPEIAAVSNGRRVRGSALAPAFQIYLSGPLDNGYKLLARFGNEVQEVLVQTSVDREGMKDFIRDCMVQDN